MERLFGTDGIRGVAGTYPLDERSIYACGRSLATHIGRQVGRSPRIVIGRDTRASGRWIEGLMTRGLIDQGTEVVSAGIIPTPGIAYLVRAREFDAGVVISASHNPTPDNGIKIFSGRGQKLEDALERAIERDIRTSPPLTTLPEPYWPDVDERLRHLYIDYLIYEIGRDLDLSGLELVIDCAHGAACEVAPKVFTALGADLHLLGDEPDGENINHLCGSLYIQELSDWMTTHHFEVGLAFDGDADRVLFAGRDGHVFDGDHLLFVVANDLKKKDQLSHDLVIATVMSNLGLEKALQERGIALHRAPVGDRFVLEKLIELDGSLGGEQSGHVIFPRISQTGDGVITALQILRVMRETGNSLAQLCRGFTLYPQKLVNVEVSSKPPFDSIPAIASHVLSIEECLHGRGRLLLRYSGTENKARIMIEADDAMLVERLTDELAQTIKEHLG